MKKYSAFQTASDKSRKEGSQDSSRVSHDHIPSDQQQSKLLASRVEFQESTLPGQNMSLYLALNCCNFTGHTAHENILRSHILAFIGVGAIAFCIIFYLKMPIALLSCSKKLKNEYPFQSCHQSPGKMDYFWWRSVVP